MAKLSIGIVGLPNVGKSTLFQLLTKQQIVVANYPFATIDKNVGVVPVPDDRLEKLTRLSLSKKVIPAVVEFYDIAGLVKGAHQGEGLGNQFLSHIREVDAVVHVLRCFRSDDIIHVEHYVDPLRDFDIIATELALKDLDTVNKRLASLEKEAKSGDKQKQKDMETLRAVRSDLEQGIFVCRLSKDVRLQGVVRELQLLTAKPQIYLLNGEEADIDEALRSTIASVGAAYLVMDLAHVTYLKPLIALAYETLGFISFFTTGEDETRAWTITRGTRAPGAAGVIHTDFEKKFIRAEVISYEKLLEAGTWNSARQKGWIRLEGKEYEVADGDVMVIRHG